VVKKSQGAAGTRSVVRRHADFPLPVPVFPLGKILARTRGKIMAFHSVERMGEISDVNGTMVGAIGCWYAVIPIEADADH